MTLLSEKIRFDDSGIRALEAKVGPLPDVTEPLRQLDADDDRIRTSAEAMRMLSATLRDIAAEAGRHEGADGWSGLGVWGWRDLWRKARRLLGWIADKALAAAEIALKISQWVLHAFFGVVKVLVRIVAWAIAIAWMLYKIYSSRSPQDAKDLPEIIRKMFWEIKLYVEYIIRQLNKVVDAIADFIDRILNWLIERIEDLRRLVRRKTA